jgi:hypothetical protein
MAMSHASPCLTTDRILSTGKVLAKKIYTGFQVLLFCFAKRSRTLSQPGKKAISYRTLTEYPWITVFL